MTFEYAIIATLFALLIVSLLLLAREVMLIGRQTPSTSAQEFEGFTDTDWIRRKKSRFRIMPAVRGCIVLLIVGLSLAGDLDNPIAVFVEANQIYFLVGLTLLYTATSFYGD